MRVIADLHIHSRFSRACSPNLTLANLAAWARTKGTDIIGTADFTHPEWRKEIESQLEPVEPGLFRLRAGFACSGSDTAPEPRDGREVRFLLTTELSCIYKKNGRTRRLHLLVFAPSIAVVGSICAELERRGANLRSDGRPILGLDAKEIVRIADEADPECMVVPAHAWTPWFSVFGSESGFDSLEECFEEFAPRIAAIETGLSSDPAMNWRLSALDGIMLISNSDAHGLHNLGREANAFDINELSYDGIVGTLRRKDRIRFLHTIEFYPEEGKYHVDGHRDCEFYCLPEETERLAGRCPKCAKPLTRGVMGRVHALADRPPGHRPKDAPGFRSIVPLEEIIASMLDKGRGTKAVSSLYGKAIQHLGPEFDILLDRDIDAISAATTPALAEAVSRARNGDIRVRPGYDGVYGAVSLFSERASAAQHMLDI